MIHFSALDEKSGSNFFLVTPHARTRAVPARILRFPVYYRLYVLNALFELSAARFSLCTLKFWVSLATLSSNAPCRHVPRQRSQFWAHCPGPTKLFSGPKFFFARPPDT